MEMFLGWIGLAIFIDLVFNNGNAIKSIIEVIKKK